MNAPLLTIYLLGKSDPISKATRLWVLGTVLLATLLVERGLSQSVEDYDHKADDVTIAFNFDHRLVVQIEAIRRENSRPSDDDYRRRGMVPPQPVFGSGIKSMISHTPDQLDDQKEHHEDKRDSDDKLLSSPSKLVYRFRYEPGAEYQFTVTALKPCDKCVSHRNTRADHPVSYRVGIDFFSDNIENRRLFVENPSGAIQYETHGHVIDLQNGTGNFSVRCIDYTPRQSVGQNNSVFHLNTISDELSAFLDFAEMAYSITEIPSTVTVSGCLDGHGANQKSSGDLSPRFLESFGYGDSLTHRTKNYTFDVVDIAEGGSLLEEKKRHPAGDIPAGFKAVTFRCTCCPNDPKYIVAFAGTDDISDVLNDAWQFFPIANLPRRPPPFSPSLESRVAPQYEYAVKYTSWVKKQFKIRGYQPPGTKKIQAVGHSLGGGIASYVSGYHKISGYGFNSAPLGAGKQIKDVMKNADEYFVQIRAIGDPVSGFIPIIPFQGLPGVVVEVECKSWIPLIPKHLVANISDKILSYR